MSNGLSIGLAFPLLAPDGSAASPSYSFAAESTLGFYRQAAGVVGLSGYFIASGYIASAIALLGSSDAAFFSLGAANDVTLYRDAADVLALRRGTNDQAFRVYETYTSPSNFRCLQITGNGLTLSSAGASISGGSLYIWNGQAGAVEFATDNTRRWVIEATGSLVPGLDNAYDIGGNSNRVSIFYGVYGNFSGYVAGGQLRVTGIGGIYPGATSGVLLLTNATEDGFSRLCFGGTTSSFPALRRAGAALEAVKADESDYATFRCSAIRDANNVQVLGAQGAAVADASGGATVDAEARTAINTLLARARAHGLIST